MDRTLLPRRKWCAWPPSNVLNVWTDYVPIARNSGWDGWRTFLATGTLGSLLAGWAAGVVPLLMVGAYCAMSSAGFALYRRDKRAARAGTMRTRERTLHLVDLLGGWPGGLLAQDRFKHKTRKAAFQFMFWTTVALNLALLAWLLTGGYVA